MNTPLQHVTNRRTLRRAILSTALSTIVARFTGMAVSLAVIPIGLAYLGEVRFGVWLTIASVVQISAFIDLGIGNALMTIVSSEPEGTPTAARPWVSNGLFLLVSTALVSGIAFLYLGFNLDWDRFLGTSTTPEVLVLVALTGTAIIISLPASVTEKTLWGLQLGHISSWWQILGSGLSIVGVLIVVRINGGLALYGAAILGPPVFVALMNGAYSFRGRIASAAPRLALLSRDRMKELIKIGGYYFGIQLVGAIAFLSDNVIVAKTLGAAAVTSLAVPARMMAVVTLVAGTALMPLWPAYGRALARHDTAWVRSVFTRSMVLTLSVAILGGIGATFLGPTVIRLWVGPDFVVEPGLLAALALSIGLQTIGIAIAMLYNSARVYRFQLLAGSLMALVAVILKIRLASVYGIVGLPVATAIAYGGIVLVPSIWVVRRLFCRFDAETSTVSR